MSPNTNHVTVMMMMMRKSKSCRPTQPPNLPAPPAESNVRPNFSLDFRDGSGDVHRVDVEDHRDVQEMPPGTSSASTTSGEAAVYQIPVVRARELIGGYFAKLKQWADDIFAHRDRVQLILLDEGHDVGIIVSGREFLCGGTPKSASHVFCWWCRSIEVDDASIVFVLRRC